jgi:hypothetical protein
MFPDERQTAGENVRIQRLSDTSRPQTPMATLRLQNGHRYAWNGTELLVISSVDLVDGY